LDDGAARADLVYHLAGVNRPQNEAEFTTGNVDLTADLLARLEAAGRTPVFVLSSSIQAERDNPYGRSKLGAEQAVLDWQRRSGASACIYRLANLFGKWSRPNYNTVVATFCHNIARGLPIAINNPDHELELCYIDDVVAAFLRHLDSPPAPERSRWTVSRTFRVTLADLADRIRALADMRGSLVVPDLADPLNRCLHATYLSFLAEDDFAGPVTLRTDNRGWLFELIKSPHFGQIFVSTTHPGITRGNHYHDTKIEKFCLIQGRAAIRFRHIFSDEVLTYEVDDQDIRIVDIPPGYTHHIENIGDVEMVVLFWANEVFDPDRMDTYFEGVQP
jgi:UDP-2-acetamido-2,6-beta-L-arabino-hexul-4-ose reductase